MTATERADKITAEERVPIVEERVVADTVEREGNTVEVRSRTVEETARVSEMLRDETVELTRNPVERIVDEDPGIRHEGDTIIIPVVEERLVVTKQLVVTEEIRLTKTIRTREHTQDVTLRRNEVDIDES